MLNLMTGTLLLSVFSVMFRLNLVDSRECGAMFIRNEPKNLRFLTNCTAILGSLSIALIDDLGSADEFHQYSFPKLKEITGYLLIYGVYGLNSTGRLFPNLSVIRGQQLVLSYSLMIFSLPHLTEVGLKSLISIQRGYVIIERCPKLCYINTIDWEALTSEDEQNLGAGKGNVIQDVEPICPTRESCRSCDNDNCWSAYHCQKDKTSHLIQPDKTNHSMRGIKCHDLCLGGCVNSTAEGCYVCSGLKLNRTCVNECPTDLFVFPDTMRCVTEKWCRDAKAIPLNGECLRICPASYSHQNPLTKEINMTECYKCDIKCPQSCGGGRINGPSDLEYFRGCNIVHGSLSIKLGLNMTDIKEKLEQTLGAIETINGALMVDRSFSLTSLSFFRNLNLINTTDMPETEKIKNPYAIEITENDNLQILFDWKDKLNFTMIGGGMSFHYNSKLCMDQIHSFQRITDYNDTHDSIGYETNGYDETCHATGISAFHDVVSHSIVNIYWSKTDFEPNKQLIGYFVYYLEALARNITHYSGLDACSPKKFRPSKDTDMPMISKSHSEVWQSVFVTYDDLKNDTGYFNMTLTNLKQYTQYAYYIRTQVSLKHMDQVLNVSQGQSPVKYFQTHPDRPRPPIVRTKNKTNTTLTLEWHPSTPENELVQKYFIDVYEMIDDIDEIDKRNYCKYPKEVKNEKNIVKTLEVICCRDQRAYLEFFQRDGNRTCGENDLNCELTYEYVLFHHHVLHTLMMADLDKDPSQRYQWKQESHESPKHHKGTTDPIKRKPDHSKYYLHSHIIDDERTDSIVVPNLKPFHLYAFYVYACNNISNCSDYYFHSDRTYPYADADNIGIDAKTLEGRSDFITLTIKPPAEPNGVTIAFEIEIYDWNRDIIDTKCLTRKEMVNMNYTYRFENLLAGTHFVKVRALSLGQNGMYSEVIMEVDDVKSNTSNLILGISLTFVVISAIVVVGKCYKKCKGCRDPQNRDLNFLRERRSSARIIQEPLIADEQPALMSSQRQIVPTSEGIQMSILQTSVLSPDQHIQVATLHSQPKVSITERISRSFNNVSNRDEESPHGSDTDESEGISIPDASDTRSSGKTKRLMDENDYKFPLL